VVTVHDEDVREAGAAPEAHMSRMMVAAVVDSPAIQSTLIIIRSYPRVVTDAAAGGEARAVRRARP
jgi:hypothetical protein